MGFSATENENHYAKKYEHHQHVISVDLKNKKISYNPDGTEESKQINIGDLTTSDIKKPENLVVLECVNALLDKGYLPQHIVLEKRWSLGHNQKSGKADICVYDQKGKKICLIIECKADHELYIAERNRMLSEDEKNPGSQLFSYWQQERSAEWLVLYTSSLVDGKIKREMSSVSCVDDEVKINESSQNPEVLLYKNAQSVADAHKTWLSTYNGFFYGDIIFQNAVAYDLDAKPLRKCDLRDFTEEDNIVDTFAEILRHNNISDKENAFNKLTALFICKLVDEMETDVNSEVQFQCGAGQTYEALQDRLQKLHKTGMEKFMREDIYYINEDEWTKELFDQYIGTNRPCLLAELKSTLRKLKYYTNNDFAFKDVHNEELFRQNGKVLVEVVNLFERFRIIGSQNLQLLGTLFENLLNKGFKQDEGQFFTPAPITRFIWNSLPLDRYFTPTGKLMHPRIIDYACGAGHFLTEGIEAIRDYVKKVTGDNKEDTTWIGNCLYGVEKDYRLARVSKIALFMHGAGEGNIIFGDGLENYEDKGVAPHTFDILVANPPYSVEGFKDHLPAHVLKQLTTSELHSSTSKEIESLFVERISQLLKPGGLAAVILPEPFLMKTNASAVAVRKLILSNFNIKAIVKLGKKTFGATAAMTVILFLEKNTSPPEKALLMKDCALNILNKGSLKEWKDSEIFPAYLSTIGVTEEQYSNFIEEKNDASYWQENEYFNQYQPLKKNFFENAKEAEKEKICYFALSYEQNPLIVETPDDNEEQKAFLGYEWSKGELKSKGTSALYDVNDRYATNCISALIRAEFNHSTLAEHFEAEKYCYHLNLAQMLNFVGKKGKFLACFNTTHETPYVTKWKTKELSSLLVSIDAENCKIPKKEILQTGKYPVITQEAARAISGYTNTEPPIKEFPVIVFGDHSCTYKYVDQPFFRGADGTQLLKTDESYCRLKYLYYFLSNMQVANQGRYERHFKYLKAKQIPIPDEISVQDDLIKDYEVLLKKITAQEQEIQKCQDEINTLFHKAKDSSSKEQTLAEVCDIAKGSVLSRSMTKEGAVPVVAAGLAPSCTHSEANRKANVITVSSSGANAGYIAWWDVPIFATDCTTVLVKESYSSLLINKYVYYALKEKQNEFYDLQTGSAQPHVYGDSFGKIKIRIPSLELQKMFIADIANLEKKISAHKRNIEKLNKEKMPLLDKYLK